MTDNELPEDVKRALQAHPAAQAKWEAMPPSHVREYLRWVNEAKKAETRRGRIETMIRKLEGDE
jgi:uncharacterized protein YdeI (YjbR/CyaY-like superfamily)